MIIIRDADEKGIPGIFKGRTRVRENHLLTEQMGKMGITHQTIPEALRKEPCIWLAVNEDWIVGFSMGNAEDACVFTMFVRPEREG
jgi:hypothetical protein